MYTTKDPDAAIGVFDSGIGGLTVLKALRAALPHENFLYVGDTAHLPYGTKSQEGIIHYTLACARFLKAKGIKILVVACNTASSVALEALKAALDPIPVIDVIGPGAIEATRASKNQHFMVLATERTVQEKAYARAIHQIHPLATVKEWPCSLFVSLAEEGWTQGPLVEAIIHKILAPVWADLQVADTLVLGCTHFPVLRGAIRAVVGENINIVDSTAVTVESVCALMTPNGQKNKGYCLLMATDNIARFKKMALILEVALDDETIELIKPEGAGE